MPAGCSMCSRIRLPGSSTPSRSTAAPCPHRGSACGSETALTATPASCTSQYRGWNPELRDRLRRELGLTFNSCLANLYRNGTDSMGYHSDNEPELGPRPLIASVSLGDRRRFVLRHRVTRERWSWDLGQGDLLVMRNESQSEYAHSVPKVSRPVGPRMNLTFRVFRPARERRSSRPASAGASGEADKIVATAPGSASADVTNEPDHSERARAGPKTRNDR